MPGEYWVTVAVTIGAIVACVVLHYECLNYLSRHLPLPQGRHRARILVLIFSILTLHIAEIWIFAGGYYFLLQIDGQGALAGTVEMNLLDCVYYSAMVFTTVGFGDILPTGALRFMTGTEAIAGLTFITWSASYTFLFMQRAWSFKRD